MTTVSIATVRYLSINLGPRVGDNDALIGIRVVPAGRDGNTVLGKTLNYGEPDSGDGITVRLGEKLLFPAGNLKVSIEDIDRENKPAPDGYTNLANTIWTWLQFRPSPDPALFRFLFAAARRLDTAHSLCVSALNERGDRSDEPYIKKRARIFKALGYAELMCVALNRATTMIKEIPSSFTVSMIVPKEVDAILPPSKAIRDALEHIDERAFGIANARGKRHPDALSIFDQKDFFSLGVLRYANHSLDLKGHVLPALISARQFIFKVAVAKAGAATTYNSPLEVDFQEAIHLVKRQPSSEGI